MEISKTSLVNLTVLFLLVTGLLLIVIIGSSSPTSFLPLKSALGCSGISAELASSEATAPAADELDAALRSASTENRTVIIAIVNRAYADPRVNSQPDSPDRTMLDLFLESFWVGEGTRDLLDHVLVVAMDQTAYAMCRFRRLNCYRLVTDGVDFTREKLYMSEDFIRMMWSRTMFLADVLRRGYSFIFTDTDVMWLRNPFSRLMSINETEDLQISTDKYKGDRWSERNNLINTGFYLVRSNNRTVSLFETWYSMKDNSNSTGKKEQDVLTDLIRDGIFRKLGLGVRFLDTLYFSGFCQDSRDFGAVVTVHANCCRSISAKVHDLSAVLRDWKQYRRFSNRSSTNEHAPNETVTSYVWSKHVGCFNSWRS